MKVSYDTDYFPPAPVIEILFGVPGETAVIGPLKAFVDTGADGTIVPARHLADLSLPVEDRKFLRSQWGERRLVETYTLDVTIGGRNLPFIEIVADDQGDEVIIGRNILGELVMTLNGPGQELEIED